MVERAKGLVARATRSTGDRRGATSSSCASRSFALATVALSSASPPAPRPSPARRNVVGVTDLPDRDGKRAGAQTRPRPARLQADQCYQRTIGSICGDSSTLVSPRVEQRRVLSKRGTAPGTGDRRAVTVSTSMRRTGPLALGGVARRRPRFAIASGAEANLIRTGHSLCAVPERNGRDRALRRPVLRARTGAFHGGFAGTISRRVRSRRPLTELLISASFGQDADGEDGISIARRFGSERYFYRHRLSNRPGPRVGRARVARPSLQHCRSRRWASMHSPPRERSRQAPRHGGWAPPAAF